MQLLVMIVDKREDLDEIFEEFIKFGIKGVTVIDSYGAGNLLAGKMSILGRLNKMTTSNKKPNKMIFSIIENPMKLERAMEMAENIVGDLKEPDSATIFTIPLGIVKGLTN